jgi:hypothetical protein
MMEKMTGAAVLKMNARPVYGACPLRNPLNSFSQGEDPQMQKALELARQL